MSKNYHQTQEGTIQTFYTYYITITYDMSSIAKK